VHGWITKDVTGHSVGVIDAEGADCPFLKRGEGLQRGGKWAMAFVWVV
jgi:hypothetical protein